MQENHRLVDHLIAAAVAVVVVFLLSVWSFPSLHPCVWDETAIAAGLLPAKDVLPGIGTYLAHLVFKLFPYSISLTIVGILGKVFLGAVAFLTYGIIAYALELISIFGVRDLVRRRIAIRLVAAVSALLFACSDPVWLAAQGFTSSSFVLLLVLLSTWLFVRLLSCATYSLAVAILFSLGLLAAESPLGFVLLAVFVFLTLRYIGTTSHPQWAKFLDPIRLQKTKWSMTFTFLGTLIFGILLECAIFAMLDGLKAYGITAGELPRLYVESYFSSILSMTNIVGLVLLVICAVVPIVLAFVLIIPATDEERYLSFKDSIAYFLLGLLAFIQLSPFAVLWFWNVSPSVTVSPLLVLFGVFLDAIALAWALYVLAIEVFCRNYQHIEEVLFQSGEDDDEDDEDTQEVKVTSVRLTPGRIAMLALPLALVIIVGYGRRLVEDRRLSGVIRAFVVETILEAGDARYVFTDGSYDSYLRLEAKRMGSLVLPVSLMSGDSPRETFIRVQGTVGPEDRLSLETGAAETIRTWVLSKSVKMREMAVQLAFEFFRLNRRLKPIVYGLLVRPDGGDEVAAAESVVRCHRLAEIIAEIQESGVWRHAKNNFLKDRFLFAQFRLAIISRLRAANLDALKRTKESLEELAYSDRLNSLNPSLTKILKRMDWIKRQNGEDLTPREGLEVAMRRADFTMARRYALPIVKEDPDEPNANFALGMSYYAEEQFAKAEEFLLRVLKRNPNEPAVHNNLALIYLKTERLNEAHKCAEKALQLRPDQPEIKDTLRQIEQAIQEANNPELKLKRELERNRK